jgi:phosphate transport system permease protein
MSTLLLDESSLDRLAQQKPQRPWRSRPVNFKLAVALAVLVPLLVITVIFTYSDLPTPLIMVAFYLPLQLIAGAIAAVTTRGARGIGDSLIIVCAIGATIFSVVILASVLWSLIVKGLPAFSAAFFTQNNVYINPSTPLEYGGIGHAVLGTIVIVLIATIVAVPLGIATAVYITEVRGRAVPYVRFFVQAMSGVPSVVAGLFILTVFVVTGIINQSAFAGGLAYAILMLPTVARTAEEVLKLVPDELRTGALALGSTRARTVSKVVLPAAKTGIITAMILGIARVVGETAPLLLTAGKNDQTILNPFGATISALPTYIFDNVALPYPDAVTRAWGSALTLMILVALLFTITRLLTGKRARR